MRFRLGIAVTVGFALTLAVKAQTQEQTSEESHRSLSQAYAALEKKDYDAAITWFRKGLDKAPGNAAAHKDLAYTYLKAGENAEARDEFESALKLDPRDETAALEFAFLAFETKKPIDARRMFDQLRKSSNAATSATAEQAFQNIDRPLAEGIARWKQALERAEKPNDLPMFSAHWELGQLAELRDELPLAAEQYEICRRLKPQLSELLLILARVWQQLNRVDEAKAALLAASRSNDSRTAEQALEQLGQRYPYPYEFQNALKLDPQNATLRKELGYLYLAMHQQAQAADQFEQLLALHPKDRAVREQLDALRGLKVRPQPDEAPQAAIPNATPAATGATSGIDAKSMGKKSLELGYTQDALKYLRLAHEQDPEDAEVMLKLGWAYNQAKDDRDALNWFDRARHTDNALVAAQANKAYHNLNGDVVPQTTVWLLPMYSSRWGDFFTYGQIKRTIPLPGLNRVNKIVSFYVSTRFFGDVKSSLVPSRVINPQYLSESSLIFGAGVTTREWHHFTGFVEAGEAVKYLFDRRDVGAAIPDYRGGLNFTKGFGSLLGSATPGLFYETTNDANYVSRFSKDWLFSSQHRAGRTFRLGSEGSIEGLFNANYLRDVKSQYWANTAEIGPGVKVHFGWMPKNVYFATDFLRGVYLNNTYNPRRPNYYDLRVSFWYAVTR